MQRNAYKKAIGERIQQLRKGLRKEGFNGQPKTVNEFLEFLNPKIDDDYDNYGDYSLTDIEFSYKKDYVSKVEHGIVFPSTDFLFLIHLRFNVSGYCAFLVAVYFSENSTFSIAISFGLL